MRSSTSTRPTVAGEVYVTSDQPDAPERGAAVAPVRTNEALSKTCRRSTTSNSWQGASPTVLALQDLVNGVVGHYGYGNGATSSLPPPPGQQ